MTRLDTVKERIAEALDATYFTQDGFIVKYEADSNPIVRIAFSAQPEYQFAISSTANDHAFTTIESPGLHADAAETFQRSDFELCISAIKRWAERIHQRQKDSILDEFGGFGG